MSIFIEDLEIKISEEVNRNSVEYRIDNGNLVSEKNLTQVVVTQMYCYPDDIRVYLKIDDYVKFVSIMITKPEFEEEKEILSVPINCNINIKRINTNSFHVLTIDEQNHDTNVVVVTIDGNDLTNIRLNYSDITEYKIYDNSVMIVCGYERVIKKYLQNVTIFDSMGKTNQVVFDKKVGRLLGFESKVKLEENNKRELIIYLKLLFLKFKYKKVQLEDGDHVDELNMLNFGLPPVYEKAEKEISENPQTSETEEKIEEN